MHGRRAQKSQIASKIGHESEDHYSYFAGGNRPPNVGNAPAGGGPQGNNYGYGGGMKPVTPPGNRSGKLFPDLQRGVAYYNGPPALPPGPPPHDDRGAANAQRYSGAMPFISVESASRHTPYGSGPASPNQPGGGASGSSEMIPKYGRRARTVESDVQDRSRQERLAQYQAELKAQKEAAELKKKLDKEQRRREDFELDERVRRDNEQKSQRERDDMARERQDAESKMDAAMGGARPRKRDPNAPAEGASSQQAGAKFGRRADQDSDKQAKEAAYRAELEQQARAVAERKAREADRQRTEDATHDARMKAWAESDGPLGQGGPAPPPQHGRQQQNLHPAENNYYGGGGPGPSNGPPVRNSTDFNHGFNGGQGYDGYNQGPPPQDPGYFGPADPSGFGAHLPT
jgi:hypothetical protein